MDAGPVQRAPAFGAGRLQPRRDVAFQRGREDEPDRRHDVRAGSQDPAHVVDVCVQRRVVDAVGGELEDRVDVVGRGDAERVGARELPRVLADLVGRRHVDPDELERRVGRRRRGSTGDRSIPSPTAPRGTASDSRAPLSPVDRQVLPGHDRRVVRGEEEHQRGRTRPPSAHGRGASPSPSAPSTHRRRPHRPCG